MNADRCIVLKAGQICLETVLHYNAKLRHYPFSTSSFFLSSLAFSLSISCLMQHKWIPDKGRKRGRGGVIGRTGKREGWTIKESGRGRNVGRLRGREGGEEEKGVGGQTEREINAGEMDEMDSWKENKRQR